MNKQEHIELNAKRYEYVRTLNIEAFGRLWLTNVRAGTPFDTLVDKAMQKQDKQTKEHRSE